MADYILLVIRNWKIAWADKKFRIVLIIELALIFTFMASTTIFFDYIEALKQGTVVNDWVLNNISAIDVSVPISILMTGTVLWMTIRTASNPNLAIILIPALTLQLAFRIVTIDMTKFFAPPGLIELRDPIGGFLYHSKFITRDLFYSGHTAVIFIFCFFSRKKLDKYLFLVCGIVVACLLLLQHVHYTFDVVFAPVFAFGIYWLSKKIVDSLNPYVSLD
jgi:hypothetical protein